MRRHAPSFGEASAAELKDVMIYKGQLIFLIKHDIFAVMPCAATTSVAQLKFQLHKLNEIDFQELGTDVG
jgi:hypothetical protein